MGYQKGNDYIRKKRAYVLGLDDKEVTEHVFEEKPYNIDKLTKFFKKSSDARVCGETEHIRSISSPALSRDEYFCIYTSHFNEKTYFPSAIGFTYLDEEESVSENLNKECKIHTG